MGKLRRTILTAALAIAFGGAASPSFADQWRYRGHDIRTFRGYDYDAWRHGYWYHGWHGGTYAWWWYGGGLWYAYPVPVYPFPNPYIPPSVVAQASPAPQAPPQSWYYCANPQGYYPYVPQCNIPWQVVPATPQ